MEGNPGTAIEQRHAPRTMGSGRDLSAMVTVFVTTVGAPSFERCLSHLAAQNTCFRVVVIERVAPLTTALQMMLDGCETPLFVQVDEDMLLEPDAIGRLYELIADEWPDVAIVVGQLVDSHLERPIEGVKIHRLDLVRQVPWTGFATVLERNEALAQAGYRIARRPIEGTSDHMTFGTHELGSAPVDIVKRYFDLELLRLSRPDEVAWFASYPDEFLRRLREEPREADLCGLVGIMAARARPGMSTAKDFREPGPQAIADAAHELWIAMHGNGGRH